jgi:hypothetical protein
LLLATTTTKPTRALRIYFGWRRLLLKLTRVCSWQTLHCVIQHNIQQGALDVLLNPRKDEIQFVSAHSDKKVR